MSKIIIQGLTQSGKKFRPSDWAERLCGAVASYDKNRRITFHPCVSLATMDHIKCVVVDPSLEEDEDMLYNFLLDFADENNLKVIQSANFPPEEAI
jgi:hypothetical protein